MAKVKIQGHASGTGVLTVTAPNTSTDRTITLPDATGTLLNSDGSAASLTAIPAANITGTLPAISGASLTGVNAVNGGRKNIIINGEMKVAQRGTSFTNPTSGHYTLDRWRAGIHTSAADGNYTQEADAPTAAQAGTNFVNCLKIDCTTADTSTADTVRYYTRYHVEGQDIAHAGFGQAGVRYMTLSFWHKHTKTGINSFGFTNHDSDRHYVAEYTQTTSDTWEKATHTFPVDTTGTWYTNSANTGLVIYLVTHIGANYESTANAWGAGNGYGTANQVNNFDSTSNNMRFTGVQLEMGSVATDFEHRSYGEELALCQRYYNQSLQGIAASNLYTNASCIYTIGFNYSGTAGVAPQVAFPTSMRAVPTMVYHTASPSTNASNNYITHYQTATSWTNVAATNHGATNHNGFHANYSGGSTGSAMLQMNYTADAEL